MNTEYLVVDDHTQGQEIKHISEIMPNICVAVFSKTFVIESIDLSDLSRFMVSSKNGYTMSETDFESD